MYGAMYKCKMCGKEFPYVAPDEEKFAIKTNDWHTPYGGGFPENRIAGKEIEPPNFIPHYCRNDFNEIGVAELIGFRDL